MGPRGLALGISVIGLLYALFCSGAGLGASGVSHPRSKQGDRGAEGMATAPRTTRGRAIQERRIHSSSRPAG